MTLEVISTIEALEVISTIEALDAKIVECNAACARGDDDAMRLMFSRFRMDLSSQLPADPFGADYRAYQNSLYETIASREYALSNERSLTFDSRASAQSPFPYYLQSSSTAGHHLLAIGFLLCKLELPPDARVLEFGPGWGNTTLELARIGMRVTAVDIEPNFCDVVRSRAAQHGVDIEVVNADFFWAETVTEPYDAVIFFESFHHCDDHLRLLRALHRAVKPGGQVYFAAEPIFPAYPVPWGVRMDGEALWAMRNFGWLELGYDATYFAAALRRTGWSGFRHVCQDVRWASVWQARRLDEPVHAAAEAIPVRGAAALWDGSSTPAEAVVPTPPPAVGDDRNAQELATILRSRSWRLTRPLRHLSWALAGVLGRRPT